MNMFIVMLQLINVTGKVIDRNLRMLHGMTGRANGQMYGRVFSNIMDLLSDCSFIIIVLRRVDDFVDLNPQAKLMIVY